MSWRTKLEKLECLKCAGSSFCEKTKGSATTTLLLSLPHAITPSVAGSSTMRYVLATNGATPAASTPAPPPFVAMVVLSITHSPFTAALIPTGILVACGCIYIVYTLADGG